MRKSSLVGQCERRVISIHVLCSQLPGVRGLGPNPGDCVHDKALDSYHEDAGLGSAALTCPLMPVVSYEAAGALAETVITVCLPELPMIGTVSVLRQTGLPKLFHSALHVSGCSPEMATEETGLGSLF